MSEMNVNAMNQEGFAMLGGNEAGMNEVGLEGYQAMNPAALQGGRRRRRRTARKSRKGRKARKGRKGRKSGRKSRKVRRSLNRNKSNGRRKNSHGSH